jgi:hypothetical protein
MTFTPGVKLGPYEILTPLGAGGMGEVYRARDTRLDRTVAIKILPPHFADDATRRQRFEREAKVISSLNHRLAQWSADGRSALAYRVPRFPTASSVSTSRPETRGYSRSSPPPTAQDSCPCETSSSPTTWGRTPTPPTTRFRACSCRRAANDMRTRQIILNGQRSWSIWGCTIQWQK